MKRELQKGTSRNDMQPWVVFFEKAQCHDGFRTLLYLIKKQKSFALFYWDIDIFCYLLRNQAYVYISLEKCLDGFVTFKVYLSEILEFFSKMSYCRRFTYLSGTSKQKWFPHRIILPFQQFYVYVSLNIFLHNEKYLIIKHKDKDFALFRQIIPTVFAQFRQIIHTFLAQFRQIMHIGSFTCLFVYRQHIINIRNMG